MIRTTLLTLILAVLIPAAVARPWIGILGWTWISLMSPHRLTYDFLRDAPVAAAVGGATLLGLLFTSEKRMPPITPVTCALLAFIVWMLITSLFAVHPDLIGVMFSKVMKIQLMIFVTLMLLYTRKHLELFIWVIVGSLAFYGIKGGIFTLRGGGVGRVWGPGGFLEGNNELALALVMTIPLMYYLRTVATNRWVRHGLLVGMLLCAVSVLGSQSRGAFLAVSAMAVYLWRHSNHKGLVGIVLVVLAAGLLAFMPASWEARMQTILDYERDGSAMGRINSWIMAWNLARDRILGGGFEVTTPYLFSLYAPNPLGVRAAHSIYFQVLGEHGFIGLGLFLLVWLLTWRNAGWLMRQARQRPDVKWAGHLGGMVQVSLVGYAVGGAFLSLAYFDLPYNILVIVVIARGLVQQQLDAEKKPAPAPVPRGASPSTVTLRQAP